MATLEEQYAQRQADAQKTYDTRQAENKALYDERQAAAQAQYDERNAAAQNTYDTRLAESQQKISDLYGKALDAQKLQYQAALDKGIDAQEQARGSIAKSYQTAANDLAVQYERNRRNLNAQALARGLNTGTGSQQQLAVNQAFSKSMGGLRSEEAAQNAGIDKAIANLKIDYQNNITQAIADNDYKKAAALMDDYNDKLNWLDNQKLNNQNRLDTLGDRNLANLDEGTASNRGYLDTQTSNNQNWLDTQTRYEQERALERAETLASYGDFSGYAELYGSAQASIMKQMWIAQNPLLAYNTGTIGVDRYRALTGEDPPGYVEPSSGGGGGGGYGGGDGGSGGGYTYDDVKEAYERLKNTEGGAQTAANAVSAARADGIISAQEAYNITTGKAQSYQGQNANAKHIESNNSLKAMVAGNKS